MHQITRAFTGTTFLVTLAALLVGFLAGQAQFSEPAVAQVATPSSIDATATREAEMEELARLRAQVAGSPVAVACTPAPTATATATPAPTATPTPVPPVASGQPVPYAEDWTITVTGVGLNPTVGSQTASGVFATVNLTVLNDGNGVRRFPFDDLLLRDVSGRTYEPSVSGSVEARLRGPAGWGTPFDPGISADAVVVFDIAPDAEGPFVLESTTDPTFRVEVSQERSG